MSATFILYCANSCGLKLVKGVKFSDLCKMKKGIHPQMQWISYVTQDGRLMHAMMTKIHHVGNVYHFRAKRQMAESLGQIAKFKRRYGQENAEAEDSAK
ncbi:hypothetical protein POTOM_002420 [Populus tomentosa]|uniref:Uncharacterized protein n=1 Tax=Populus tomentosa TaxID=118781 RepID=A0A8X8DJK3_POPTO|nr:hypothetical protein POTOM_002420 [Populus tomentosa]